MPDDASFHQWLLCLAQTLDRAAKDETDSSAAQLVKNCFEENRRRYGSRRIQAGLQKAGEQIGRFQVRQLMREQNLRAIQPKKFVPQTTDSRGTIASPNLLKELKLASASAAGKIIIGDITYLPLASGQWCYLGVWQDTRDKTNNRLASFGNNDD